MLSFLIGLFYTVAVLGVLVVVALYAVPRLRVRVVRRRSPSVKE